MGKRLAITVAFLALGLGVALTVNRAVLAPAIAARVPVDAVTSSDASAPPPDVAIAEQVVAARLIKTSGSVDRKQGDKWVSLVPGDKITPDDVIRTRKDGKATLEIAGVIIELDTVTQISNLVASQVSLAQGRVIAQTKDRGFRVAVDSTDTVASVEKGKFAVLADGTSTTVAALEGVAQVTANGQTQEISPGKLSTVESGQGPSRPVPIAPSLFLNVKRPKQRAQRTKKLALSGKTAPGAFLRINGRRIRVDAEGRFTAVLSLGEGRNRVVLKARDVLGREQSDKVNVSVDSKGPNVGGTVDWGRP